MGDAEEHGLPSSAVAFWIMSNSVHKSFQDTEVSKSGDKPLDSVNCSKSLMMRHGVGIVTDLDFGLSV